MNSREGYGWAIKQKSSQLESNYSPSGTLKRVPTMYELSKLEQGKLSIIKGEQHYLSNHGSELNLTRSFNQKKLYVYRWRQAYFIEAYVPIKEQGNYMFAHGNISATIMMGTHQYKVSLLAKDHVITNIQCDNDPGFHKKIQQVRGMNASNAVHGFLIHQFKWHQWTVSCQFIIAAGIKAFLGGILFYLMKKSDWK